jgi:hypothetical protein
VFLMISDFHVRFACLLHDQLCPSENARMLVLSKAHTCNDVLLHKDGFKHDPHTQEATYAR